MEKSFWKKLKRRVKKDLHKYKHHEHSHSEDFEVAAYRLVSCNIWNLGGSKKKKGIRSPPVSGYALYYVAKVSNKDGMVTLLHPVSLDVCQVNKRQFEKSIEEVWWPNEAAISNPEAKNKYGCFCNRFNVAKTMLSKMADYHRRNKNFKQKIVRAAISDLKEIPLKDVPEYEIKVVDHLQKWRDNLPEYKKRASQYIKEKTMSKTKDKEKSSVVSGSVASSDTPSSSVSSSPSASSSSGSNDKEKKVKKSGKKTSKKESKKEKKGSKKEKTDKKEPKEKGGLKIPRGEKTSKGVVIRLLVKKKGKTVSMQELQEAVQKAKGVKKEIPEKKILSKSKEIGKWAESQGLTFKSSSKGMSLK